MHTMGCAARAAGAAAGLSEKAQASGDIHRFSHDTIAMVVINSNADGVHVVSGDCAPDPQLIPAGRVRSHVKL